ncbi:MAG: PilZ domain-containing protein [Nitrospirota bacterium]|nr:PilZ domain-containing protein [Nitrospirota bacterium]MDE3036185.1 PilZ domain-containing protein [Nitrospirota bacterium]MDE3118765.1 PilZ domain-containing protein [Nitrospirota bacterium]MDE3223960.1 PilZ domain-containing protein [Nitrospirota bacterium]MDE3241730.1 PilZ domain-containing protein [Nitrospirota bacterium]
MERRCPNCDQPYVQRANREGRLDRLLSAFYVYPFRCQLCTHRFHAIEWGRRYAHEPVDQRQYERFEVQCPAWFSVGQKQGPDLEGEATVTDLSMGGCGLDTRFLFEPGMLLRLKIQTWEDQLPVTVKSAVVRVVRPRTVGIEFLDVPPADKERLSQFVKGLLLLSRR